MSSTDYGSTVYDIIFVGGMVLSILLYHGCCCQPVYTDHLNWVRRGYCLCYCRSSCRGWSFPENSGKVSKESLIHQYFFWTQIAQIVEAGPHTRDEPNHIQPGRYLSCFIRPTETFTFHMAEPSPAVCNRSVPVPTGRALGGGSSVNCMKANFVIINLPSWSYILKLCFTQGQRLRITMIGKTYMGIKDGVLSIWYRFSKKLGILRST